MLSANRGDFSSSFLNMIFVSYLFALVGPSRIMLNQIGKSGYPFVVSDLRQVSSFTTEDGVSCLLFFYGLYFVEYVPSPPSFLCVFIVNGSWIFPNVFPFV